MELTQEKSFSFQEDHGTQVQMTIKASLQNLDKADLENILHDYALHSRQFYLTLGKAISATDQ